MPRRIPSAVLVQNNGVLSGMPRPKENVQIVAKRWFGLILP
jgi:hypothetical protein